MIFAKMKKRWEIHLATLWYGGKIYTLQAENHQVEAVLTKGDKIIAIGTIAELENQHHAEIAERINLNGDTMLPGFVDSHLHLIGHGEKLIRLDLSRCQSKAEVLSAVKEYAKKMPEGEWIIGEGWNENLWGANRQLITAKDLDESIPNHPVLLKRICRHALVANSAALHLASIDESTVSPPGGIIEKDEQGSLTGLLKDRAYDLLFSALPVVSEGYLHNALTAAIKDAYTVGLTGAHTEDLNYYGGFARTYQTFQRVIEEEGNHFRAHLLVHHEVIDEMKKAGESFHSGSKWIEFGAMKIFSDGALGGRTALLSHPYGDDPSTSGVAIFTQEQLNQLVKKAREYELPVAVHAIGDLAFEMVLQAIEKHPLQGPGRDRLIHAQILRQELIERAKKLPLILDIQPRFLASDFPWVLERIGANRRGYFYAWKTLLQNGLSCAGGSDAPIEPLNPLLGIHAAVTRTNVDDQDHFVYHPDERLTVYEAVELFTKGSAYAACHEMDRGLIKEGYLADFTILHADIFTIVEDLIPNIAVSKTVIGGEIVFERQGNQS